MCKASCSKIIESLYFKRATRNHSASPPGSRNPAPRTAAAHGLAPRPRPGRSRSCSQRPAPRRADGCSGSSVARCPQGWRLPILGTSPLACLFEVRCPRWPGGSCLSWIVPFPAGCSWKLCSRNGWAGLAWKRLGSLPPLWASPGWEPSWDSVRPHTRVGPRIEPVLGTVILEMGMRGVVTIPFFFFFLMIEK